MGAKGGGQMLNKAKMVTGIRTGWHRDENCSKSVDSVVQKVRLSSPPIFEINSVNFSVLKSWRIYGSISSYFFVEKTNMKNIEIKRKKK